MRKKKIDAFPYLMCLAAVVLFTLFVVLPFAVGVYTSFFKWDGFSDMKFNGLKNYLYVFQDDIYWKAIKNTFVYAILVTVLKNVIAFFLASILVKNFFGRTFFRTAIYIPVTLSYIVIGILWVWIYNPTFGLLNSFLSAVGLDQLILGWLSDARVALFAIIAVDVWKWIGYHMVLYIAGLQAVPKDLYEAAEIDGANRWQQIVNITIPSLVPMITVMLLLSVGNIMRSDTGLFYQVTRNSGQLYSTTQVIDSYVLNAIFKNSNFGFVAATTFFQSVVGLLMMLLANGAVRKIAPENALF